VTYVLIAEGPIAVAGLAVLGLFALWLVVDYPAGAIGLMTLSILVPNGVALYFGPAVPLLTFQRAMLLLLVVTIVFHVPVRFLALAWTAAGLMLKDAVRSSRWRLLPGYFAVLRTIVRGLLRVRGL
jgi:hypothetical protein